MENLSKSFEPKEIEKKWYQYWEEKELFKADPNSSKNPYCIVMPPPNVTGVLHMGHALVNTIQDILIRYKRMDGFEALWVPGTDHAGIATQTVVERHLFAKTGKRRKDFDREEFLQHIWNWKETHQNRIISQIKMLGASCDWSRLRFTMDEQSNDCVRKIFKRMYDDGIIYRGDYLVNWDPVTQTALADDEVEYEEKESSIWYFRYPIENTQQQLVIATTRPETMLGDTAVAVHPNDPRFASLIGKNIQLPLSNRLIPIIADHYVDPDFGSGAVKITPAHDPNDFEIGNRHNLPFINIMTPDGHINEDMPKQFQKLSMQKARKAVVEEMKKLDLIEKIEPYPLRVGVSYRSKAIIEPYLSKQWFVKTTQFKDKLIEVVKTGKVKLIPESWQNTYFHWIENLRDWCISRQLWWGHRIPVWYNKKDPTQIICHDGKDIPKEVLNDPESWYQDEDVLDTWFSSGTWPFSVLGWPQKTPEFNKFFPTSVLVTAHDILFFWVARMILMSEYALNEVPFRETFLHGLIYGKSYWKEHDHHLQYLSSEEKKKYDLGEKIPKDVFSKWEKMSKSKGNVIDPVEIINEYGADAMRMALTSSVTHARQIDLDRRKFEEFKNFANKIWNGARFIFMNITDLSKEEFSKGLDPDLFTLEDKWILSLLNKNISLVRKYLDSYQLDKAANLAYEFFWKEFCAYYLELIKPTIFGKQLTVAHKHNKQKVLVILLSSLVRLLHPMAPFITEEIFSILKEMFTSNEVESAVDLYTKDTLDALACDACMKASYPNVIDPPSVNDTIEKDFLFMQDLVYAIRNIRAEMQMPPSEKIDVIIQGTTTNPEFQLAKENSGFIESLIKVNEITFTESEPAKVFGSTSVVKSLKIFVPLPNHLKEKEKSRLIKEEEKLHKACAATKSRLDNPDFLQKAPQEVILKMKETLADNEQKLAEILQKLKSF
ncbi:MAG: valine--tRNA ligase [Chlamydiae bacterium CG10_big_fil_rev_8_21_14_0_10_35_9]|nr:MAG: valine--tRNA ligase [Chlamydiae bacterium CG10_big_fil_rev_8_21_14_0_10_35_9]